MNKYNVVSLSKMNKEQIRKLTKRDIQSMDMYCKYYLYDRKKASLTKLQRSYFGKFSPSELEQCRSMLSTILYK